MVCQYIEDVAVTDGHPLLIQMRFIDGAYANACANIDSVIVHPPQHSFRSLYEGYQSCHVETPPSVAWGTFRSIMHQERPHIWVSLRT